MGKKKNLVILGVIAVLIVVLAAAALLMPKSASVSGPQPVSGTVRESDAAALPLQTAMQDASASGQRTRLSFIFIHRQVLAGRALIVSSFSAIMLQGSFPSADAALHFQADQVVHLHRVFQRQLLGVTVSRQILLIPQTAPAVQLMALLRFPIRIYRFNFAKGVNFNGRPQNEAPSQEGQAQSLSVLR